MKTIIFWCRNHLTNLSDMSKTPPRGRNLSSNWDVQEPPRITILLRSSLPPSVWRENFNQEKYLGLKSYESLISYFRNDMKFKGIKLVTSTENLFLWGIFFTKRQVFFQGAQLHVDTLPDIIPTRSVLKKSCRGDAFMIYHWMSWNDCIKRQGGGGSRPCIFLQPNFLIYLSSLEWGGGGGGVSEQLSWNTWVRAQGFYKISPLDASYCITVCGD